MCFAQTAPKLLFGTTKLTSVKDRLDRVFFRQKKALGSRVSLVINNDTYNNSPNFTV